MPEGPTFIRSGRRRLQNVQINSRTTEEDFVKTPAEAAEIE